MEKEKREIKSLDSLRKGLQQAKEEYEAAEVEAREIRRKKSSLRERYCKIQDEFDREVKETKKTFTNIETNWKPGDGPGTSFTD